MRKIGYFRATLLLLAAVVEFKCEELFLTQTKANTKAKEAERLNYEYSR